MDITLQEWNNHLDAIPAEEFLHKLETAKPCGLGDGFAKATWNKIARNAMVFDMLDTMVKAMGELGLKPANNANGYRGFYGQDQEISFRDACGLMEHRSLYGIRVSVKDDAVHIDWTRGNIHRGGCIYDPMKIVVTKDQYAKALAFMVLPKPGCYFWLQYNKFQRTVSYVPNGYENTWVYL